MKPNRRVSEISLSTTIALDTRAKELAASGRAVINMAVGEPDLAAPTAARRAAVELVESGRVKYTPAPGSAALRATVAAHLAETRGVPWTPAEVCVCHSAKHALSGALLTLVEPGDEVLLLVPAWVSYFEQVRFAGGVPVGVDPRPDLGPDLDRVRAAIGPKTRGILLNSPCNPSGYVFSRAEIAALSELAVEHDLWILSDEIYRRLVYEGPPNVSPVEIDARMRERTVIVDGASKAFAMTGYRIGYAAGPADVIGAIGRLHSQLTGCPNAVSQAAFDAALRDSDEEVEAMRRQFDARREVLAGGLSRMGLDLPRPRGAFYVFADVRPWLDERGSDGFCADLLDDQEVALVPGSAFGMDSHVRFSYAVPIETLEKALERVEKFLATRPRRAASPL